MVPKQGFLRVILIFWDLFRQRGVNRGPALPVCRHVSVSTSTSLPIPKGAEEYRPNSTTTLPTSLDSGIASFALAGFRRWQSPSHGRCARTRQ